MKPDGEESEDYSSEAGELWCPKCGAVMYADADRCPSCGDYVTPGARRSPLWIRAAAILLILLIVAGLLASLFLR